MSQRRLLMIDKVFWLLWLVLNLFHRVIRSGNKSSQPGRILIIKLMGMGSIIKMTTLIDDLQKDKSDIVLCTAEDNRIICELMGYTSIQTINFHNPIRFIKDVLKMMIYVRTYRPRMIINLERGVNTVSVFQMMLSWISGSNTLSFSIKNEKGSSRDQLIPLEGFTHEQVLKKGLQPLRSSIPVSRTRDVKVESKNILININASDYVLARRYPKSGFEKIIKALLSINPEYKIYLTGSRSEKSYVDSLVGELATSKNVFNVAGEWNLNQLTENLATCRLFITNDSGPMHLAAYLKIPAIVIWGPTHYHHFGYHNILSMHNVSIELPCSPCFTNPVSKVAAPCNGTLACINQLYPELIINKAKQILSKTELFRTIEIPDGMRSSVILESRMLTSA